MFWPGSAPATPGKHVGLTRNWNAHPTCVSGCWPRAADSQRVLAWNLITCPTDLLGGDWLGSGLGDENYFTQNIELILSNLPTEQGLRCCIGFSQLVSFRYHKYPSPQSYGFFFATQQWLNDAVESLIGVPCNVHHVSGAIATTNLKTLVTTTSFEKLI
jgi:hypothetical protein